MERINTISGARIEAFPTMNWGAIFAGWTVALGVAALLYLGGLALGLASIHAHAEEGTGKAIAVGAAIWTLLTWTGALFVGGMVASWFDGKNDTMMGAMHGLSVWGLAIAIAVVLMVLGGHHARRAPMGGPMHEAMMTRDGGRVGFDMAILHAQLIHAVHHDGGDVASQPLSSDQEIAGMPSDADAHEPWRQGRYDGGLLGVEMALAHGDTASAKALLVAQARLSPAESDRVVQAVMPQVEKTRSDAKIVAADAAHRAAAVAAITFLSTLFGLLAALLGGWIGANHVHKVYHLRTYTRLDSTPQA